MYVHTFFYDIICNSAKWSECSVIKPTPTNKGGF